MIRIESKIPLPPSFVLSQLQQRSDSQSQRDASRTKYEGLTSAAKADLRAHLYAEQSGRCAYCERNLERDFSDTKIEHFHPRNEAFGLPWNRTCQSRTHVSRNKWGLIEISIGNLLLCCRGGEERGRESFTCDTKKGNQHICDEFFSPKATASDALVQIRPDGKAVAYKYPSSVPDEAQTLLDETFGLNVWYLQEHRRKLFTSLLRNFTLMKIDDRGRTPARTLREQEALKLREASKTAEFGSTILSVAELIKSVVQ